MTRVYSHPDPSITHLVQNALRSAGIDAVVQGERHGAAMGEVPPIAAWSEVWVGDGAALEAARAVVAEVTREPAETPSPWTCALCGETVEGQFGACWSCGNPQPEG
ncbi:MAG TPA: DUF2007 domain-containing protein [Bacteroidetes bacterium]|nr:DUF2007 domain-containing protein [Bacteroidota bacterium]HIL56676.1 DUF2007 domain-containing protein [Rhodothermales bacterium]